MNNSSRRCMADCHQFVSYSIHVMFIIRLGLGLCWAHCKKLKVGQLLKITHVTDSLVWARVSGETQWVIELLEMGYKLAPILLIWLWSCMASHISKYGEMTHNLSVSHITYYTINIVTFYENEFKARNHKRYPVCPLHCLPIALSVNFPVCPLPCVPMALCAHCPVCPLPRVPIAPCAHCPVCPLPCVPGALSAHCLIWI